MGEIENQILEKSDISNGNGLSTTFDPFELRQKTKLLSCVLFFNSQVLSLDSHVTLKSTYISPIL